MAHLSIEFCRKLAHARRTQGLTQSALAQAVGCQQSAISMLESGQPDKLALDTVRKIADRLQIEFEEPDPATSPTNLPPAPAAPPAALGFCPTATCPTNLPLMVGDTLLFWPRLQNLSHGPHCATCGELLESACPACSTPISTDGACCRACGTPRVTDTLPPATPRPLWVEQRLRELSTLNTLIK